MKKIFYILVFCCVQQVVPAQQTIDTLVKAYVKYVNYNTNTFSAASPMFVNYVLINNSSKYAYYQIRQYTDLQASIDATLELNKIDKSNIEQKRAIEFTQKLFNKDNAEPETYFLIDTKTDSMYYASTFYYLNNKKVRTNMLIAKQQFTFYNDTTIILGYTCKKAQCFIDNHKYTVWYAEDLPYNAGPYGCYGAPGLILKIYVEDTNEYTEATEINFKNPAEKLFYKKIAIPTEGELITMKQALALSSKNLDIKSAAQSKRTFNNYNLD